jgi:hypothetical protein
VGRLGLHQLKQVDLQEAQLGLHRQQDHQRELALAVHHQEAYQRPLQ